MTVDISARLLAEDLLAASAMLVDKGDFDAWTALFEPAGRYMVIPRENRDLGYPIALISCTTRAVLEDRITVLNKASKFNPHVDRHILSKTVFKAAGPGLVKAETNFTIIQSSMEGVSKLFCAGTYEDVIAVEGDTALFRERVAVIDTFSVPNLIATPI